MFPASQRNRWRQNITFNRTSTLTAAAFATAIGVPAMAETSSGTPVTAEKLVAHAEMIRIAGTIDAAVDAKDETLVRSFLPMRSVSISRL